MLGIKTATRFLILTLVGDQRTIKTGVFGDLADRLFKRSANDVVSSALIFGKLGKIDFLKNLGSLDLGSATARDNSLFDRGSSC